MDGRNDGKLPAVMSSVDNALRLILLVSGRDLVRVTDVSNELNVGASTAHRLLTALETRGFVGHDDRSRTYYPGPALTDIALAVEREMSIRDFLRPFMQELVDQIGETVSLMTLRGDRIQFIEVLQAPRALRTVYTLGSTVPAHCTAGGKAMLARLDDAELLSRYPSERLAVVTERSISTREQLVSDLAAVHHRGYAIARQEGEDGVCGVGVALSGTQPRTVFGLAVSGPTQRITARAVPKIARTLKDVAAEAALSL